jgi:signal transduction histidine kinase
MPEQARYTTASPEDDRAIAFFDAVLYYSKRKKFETNHQNLVVQGLNVLLEFPYAVSASAYLMNEETFEFEHYSTVPLTESTHMQSLYAELVAGGAVGKALSTDYISFYPESPNTGTSNLFYMTIPLVCSRGVIGLIVLALNTDPGRITKYLLQNCILFAEIISQKIENESLTSTQLFTHQYFEQKVAYRTIRLVQDKKTIQERLNELRSNLTMSLPHEIRTPLNEILGYSSFLKNNFRETEYEDAQQMLAFIRTSSERLHRLFEQYLLYAQLEIISYNPVDILNLQSKVAPSLEAILINIASYQFEISGRTDDLQFDITDAPLSISEDLLTRMIQELVDNCIKYSEKGTPVIISSRLEEDSQLMEIRFYSEGRGMTREQIESIGAYVQFERKIYEQQGSGLGLAIVTRIIDLHNGHFTIDSNPGKSTTLIVEMPVSPFLV